MKQHSRILGLGSLLVLDRVVKWLATTVAPTNERDFFSFGYYINQSAVFSWPLSNEVMIVFGVIALLILGVCVVRGAMISPQGVWWLVLLLIVGGMSNLVDRLMYGGVVDVFHVWGGLSFNLADVYLVMGVILLFRKVSRPPLAPSH